MFLWLLIGTCALFWGLLIRTWTRNNAVLVFRKSLIDDLHEACNADIWGGREWKWRFDVFTSVSYGRMVMSSRRLRAENFYDDLSFLDPEGRPS